MAFFEKHSDLVYIKEEQVVSSWNASIPAAAGNADKFFEEIEQQIKALGIPDLVVERKQVDSKGASAFIHKVVPRTCLYVHSAAEPVAGFDTFIVFRDYGQNLLAARYVVSSVVADTLNLFGKEELTASMSLIHHAVLTAVKKVMGELNQDFSLISTQSKGILDIA